MKAFLLFFLSTVILAYPNSGKAAEPSEITHSFLVCGQKTYIMAEDGKASWTYPDSTRDGYVIENGNLILTLSKSNKYSGGAVVEVTPMGDETLIWQGTQAEVNSAQPTDSGTFVITEAGPNPRLLEVNHSGNVVIEFALGCQKENFHMQTRMSRKLADGSYLVPHLFDFQVVNYDSKGNTLRTWDTTVAGDSKRVIHTWPFTAIRHGDNHMLVCCTNGNRVVDFDASGKIVWELTNDDLPGPWLQDPCGAQVLPNGNFVITSYHAGQIDANAPKLIEVNQEKKVVWTYTDGNPTGIHHFQILSTNGKPLEGPVLK